MSQKGKKFLLISALTLFWIIISINSYGTGDVKLWLSWARQFNESGFWENFYELSDIPLLTTMFVHLSGYLTKIIYGTINESSFPDVLKILQIPFLLIIVKFSLSFLKKSKRMALSSPIILMLLLNPAIILNLGFLGYLDILFATSLIGSVYLLNLLNLKKRHSQINAIIFFAVLVIAPFIKPQFIMFLPILMIFGIIIIFKNSLIKASLTGLLIGVILILISISVGSGSLKEVFIRLNWIYTIFGGRIMGQAFVVANFPNAWQVYNFIYHHCVSSCSLNTIFYQELGYWIDKPLAMSGKKLFYSAVIFYGFFFIKGLFSKSSLILRKSYTKTVIVASLWMNVIYSFFNTSVHENHLIATVFLSVLLFAIEPNAKNFKIFIYFTLINFIILYYYYGFGLSGFNGYLPPHNFGGISITALLIFIYGGSLIYFTRRLIKGYLE